MRVDEWERRGEKVAITKPRSLNSERGPVQNPPNQKQTSFKTKRFTKDYGTRPQDRNEVEARPWNRHRGT